MDSPFRNARPAMGSESSPPPPLYVKYVVQGEVRNAWRSAQIPYRAPRPRKAAKRAGVAYQRRIESCLDGIGVGALELGPWFCFVDDSGERHYCQPDFVAIAPSFVVAGEIKLRWTSDAWWQLRKLYLPVLAKVFSRPVIPVCVCRSYDPSIPVPDPIRIVSRLAEATDPEILSVMVVP